MFNFDAAKVSSFGELPNNFPTFRTISMRQLHVFYDKSPENPSKTVA